MEKPVIESVRRLVLTTIAQLADATNAPISLVERALEHGPEQLGRRFQYRGIRAVWFADSGVIDFFTEDGHLLATVPDTLRDAEPIAA